MPYYNDIFMVCQAQLFHITIKTLLHECIDIVCTLQLLISEDITGSLLGMCKIVNNNTTSDWIKSLSCLLSKQYWPTSYLYEPELLMKTHSYSNVNFQYYQILKQDVGCINTTNSQTTQRHFTDLHLLPSKCIWYIIKRSALIYNI